MYFTHLPQGLFFLPIIQK